MLQWEIRTVLLVGAFLRGFLVIYGSIHDVIFKVKYTDVDYTVFTSAAKAICEGHSPYNRRDYRYSPIVAFLLLPSCYGPWFSNIGKIVFSLFDILCAAIIYHILSKSGSNKNNNELKINVLVSVAAWLFNPIVCIVSTRGNCDSLISVILLSTLLLASNNRPFLCGLMYGLAIHVRLYPVIFLPAFIVYFGKRLITPTPHLLSLKGIYYLILSSLSKSNVLFLVATLVSVALSTATFYYLYGFQFLHSSLLYHLGRQDIKHNFSAYFYAIYLQAPDVFSPIVGTGVIFGTQVILIALIAITCVKIADHSSLNLALFLITLVFIVFNKVYTVQYYTWYFCLLPLLELTSLAQQFQQLFTRLLAIRFKASTTGFGALMLWLIAQGSWLGSAYLLEFSGSNTFLAVWISGLALLILNSLIISACILAKSEKVKIKRN